MSIKVYGTLQYPDKFLARAGKSVAVLDESILSIVKNLYATLAAQQNCAALAATQLGVDLCITVINHSIVMDGFISCSALDGSASDFISQDNPRPLCLINPIIISRSADMVNEAEGCMSVGGDIRERVKRNRQVSCEFLSDENEKLIVVAEGFLSRCIQHELDHLQGRLFIDNLSPLKRKLVDRKFLKRTKQKS